MSSAGLPPRSTHNTFETGLATADPLGHLRVGVAELALVPALGSKMNASETCTVAKVCHRNGVRFAAGCYGGDVGGRARLAVASTKVHDAAHSAAFTMQSLPGKTELCDKPSIGAPPCKVNRLPAGF